MAFYLCEVIGDGLSEETAFRPAIAEYQGNWSVLDGRADATQPTGRMLVRCAPNALAELDPRIKRVTKLLIEQADAPDDGELTEQAAAKKIAKRLLLRAKLRTDDFGGLDITIGEIPVAKRQRINMRLTALGFDTSRLRLSMTVRDALRDLLGQSSFTRFCD